MPECLLIEPTETESKETLDNFVAAMIEIVRSAKEDGVSYKEAPYKMPVRRLDDVKAARELESRLPAATNRGRVRASDCAQIGNGFPASSPE